MNCVFQKENDKLVCVNCKFSLPYKEYKGGIQRNCTKPSKITKVKNLGKEVKKQASAIIKSDVVTDGELNEERKKICEECPHYQHNRCKLCGCFINFKTLLKHANCPIGKW